MSQLRLHIRDRNPACTAWCCTFRKENEMRKVILFVASVMAVTAIHAAAVGWNVAGAGKSYAGNAYMVFVVGQKGADLATITALLDAGSNVDAYVFGNGVLNQSGVGSVTGTASGKTLDVGTYTAFMVLFDSAAPTSGDNYLLISGVPTLTKEVGATTAAITFATGSIANLVANASNWKSYGTGVPEPTSGLLLLVGGAMLALRRKQR